ncbi:MAG: AraC family transcriptional regulator [Oscillospiraceae bacterium]|nr:AraC family transcriptional regulator [Oscillospiraceae bacterium]
MDRKLLERLSRISDEERKISNGCGIDMTVYSDAHKNAVDAEKLLGDAQLIRIRPHTRFAAFPRHRHDFVEIMYVCKGSITHVVGDRKITIRAGELLFLGSNTWHEILPAGQNDVAVNFLIRPAFFHTAFDMMDEQNVLSDFIIASLAGDGSADEFLHFSVSDVLPVQNLVENLLYSLCYAEEGSEKINEVTMGLLFLRLMRVTTRAETGGGPPRTLALRALGYINKSYLSATLRQFAEQNGVPDYTASRIIKAQLGASFQQLLQEKRFSVARQLLRTTKLPVTEVITLVGYENTSYFHRAFRKKYGMSPQQYRRSKER